MRASRIVATVGAVLLATLAAPSMAGAHLRTGIVAVDYGADVVSPRPFPDAPFTVGVYSSDRALHLTVRRGHTVVVIGYLGERFLRVGPAGVEVKLDSPTAAAAGVLTKSERARRDAAGWRVSPGRRSVVWHDARVQRLPPGVSRASWSVPILVDGRPERIAGDVWRLPRPALWPWLIIVALLALLAVPLGLGGDVRWLRAGSILLGAVAASAGIVTAAGFALGAYASPGMWIAGLDELAFAVAGFGVLACSPRIAHVPAGIFLGLLGLAVGLSKGEVFVRGGVLSALPADVTRAAAALAVGAGVASAITGGLFYARTDSLEPPPHVLSPPRR